MAKAAVDVQVACDDSDIPAGQTIARWVTSAFGHAAVASQPDAEVAVRVVGSDEIRALNRRYRGKDSPTNVLSFPAATVDGLPAGAPRPLGDIVVCAAVVRDEAAAQQKPVADHWAHMLVHGTLHLLGFDHETDDEAARMEAIERSILASGNVPDPYAEA